MSSGAVEARQLKFLTDPLYGDHLRGAGHPERPDRVEVVAARLRREGVIRETLAARDATADELERVHTRPYIDLVQREAAAASEARELSTGDVTIDRSSYAAALRAAGGAIVATQAAVDGNEPVFALIRPPGHHAEPAIGMGFCLFNNAAIAARACDLGRVLVVDFDYHHGNGTEAVAGRGLSYVSTHASPAYPGTGLRSYWTGDDLVANVPLPASGISTEAFVATWQAVLPAVARAVKPDLLIVSAGFDYVAGDPVGDLGVGVEAAGELAALIAETAAEHCGRRIAYLLEGGYDLHAIGASIRQIARPPSRPVPGDPSSIPRSVANAINEISALSQGSVNPP